MKRNILLLLLTIVLSIVCIYPLGYVFNQFIFHQQGGGFDVGPDENMINIFIGTMATPPLLSAFIFGIWGKSKWRWLFATIISVPSIILFRWAGIYMIVPLVSFLFGVILAKSINFLAEKFRHQNSPNSF